LVFAVLKQRSNCEVGILCQGRRKTPKYSSKWTASPPLNSSVERLLVADSVEKLQLNK